MTAINMFAQGDTALMLADSATTSLTGEPLSTDDKITVLPQQRMAIGWTGYGPSSAGDPKQRLQAAVEQQGVELSSSPQADVLACLPSALTAMHRSNLEWLDGCEGILELAELNLLVACWNEIDGPMLFAANAGSTLGGSGTALHRLRHAFATDGKEPDAFLKATFGHVPNLSDSTSFDVRKDGLRLGYRSSPAVLA
jgi:hypothetical protein